MSQALKLRLEKSQAALETAIDNASYEETAALLEARTPDITALVEHIQGHPEDREWVQRFLERDRDITARLNAAYTQYQRRVDEATSVRKVHRAYIEQG